LRVGVDAVAVARLERLIRDHPDRCEEIFTLGELEYCRTKRRSCEHLAARFAAKEAVLKAFGTGVRQRMSWTEVEIVNDAGGRPRVKLGGAVASFARHNGLRGLDVSLTHTDGLALAHAIAVWTRPAGEDELGAQCAFT
jgi:holo-[acyl-carrier protein] synthase